jgi:diguanylate cyclase (GGDEF)-like protein
MKLAFRKSLSFVTMLQMAVRITIVVIAIAALSYWHIINNLEQQTLDKLEKYIIERTLKENTIFQLAEDNHTVFKNEFLALWPERKNVAAEPRFSQLFFSPGDGTTRLKKEVFDGIVREHNSPSSYLGLSNSISGFVGRGAPVEDNQFQNRLLLSFDLVDRFAQGWSNRFANTYVSMPEGVNIVHWPNLPWALNAEATLDISKEEWAYIANNENNPKRQSVWTGLYYDQTADEWMVSCETPVDDENGQHLITVGHDILLNKIFDRVFNDYLDGTYNFIFRSDGRLIAHPHKVNELKAASGVLNIDELADEKLLDQYSSIIASINFNDGQSHILNKTKHSDDAFIAFAPIKGPDWYFVTVYPKELLSEPAKKAAEFIFIIGTVGLIIEIIFLFFVLRKNVIRPLTSFVSATERVSEGRYDMSDIHLPVHQENEIGLLAKTFRKMSNRLQDYKFNLEMKITARTKELEEIKIFAETQARTDPLTNLPNRRAFFEFGRLEIEEFKRYGHDLTLIMLDIDRFKNINDTYGHAVGDEVLKGLAILLLETTRSSDLAARIGGEEFAILLSHTKLEDGESIAEKLREEIQASTIKINNIELTYTASFGVVTYTQDKQSLDTLLDHADRALYQAKESGRNRVVVEKNNS